MVFVPHCLTYFTQHNALQFHPCHCKGYKLLLSECPSANEWIRKLWYIDTMEFYAADIFTTLATFILPLDPSLCSMLIPCIEKNFLQKSVFCCQLTLSVFSILILHFLESEMFSLDLRYRVVSHHFFPSLRAVNKYQSLSSGVLCF